MNIKNIVSLLVISGDDYMSLHVYGSAQCLTQSKYLAVSSDLTLTKVNEWAARMQPPGPRRTAVAGPLPSPYTSPHLPFPGG